MYYYKKEVIKFRVFKIKLLRSLETFSLSDDVESGMNIFQMDLNKLAFKINNKITKEFYVTVDEVLNEEFPLEVRDFESYEIHEQEHRQLSKILKYIKKFLKSLLIQVIYDKFNQKWRQDKKKKNKCQEIHKMDFNYQNMQIDIISGKIYFMSFQLI